MTCFRVKEFVLGGLTALLLLGCSEESVTEPKFDAAVVCPIEGTNSYGMPNRGTFIDERDGQEYNYTTIGQQVWMAQNLNYETDYSIESHMNKEYGEQYLREIGLLYNLTIELPDRDILDNQICPPGWTLPSVKDFEILIDAVNGDILKLSKEWKRFGEYSKGPDDCGFSIIHSGSVKVVENIANELVNRIDNDNTSFYTKTLAAAYELYQWEAFPWSKSQGFATTLYTSGYPGYYRSVRCLKEL